MATTTTKALRVYGWQSFRREAKSAHRQTREIVAAPSKAEARRLTGAARPGQLHNFTETRNASEIKVALTLPGTVFWREIDDYHGAYVAASPRVPAPAPAWVGDAQRPAPVATGTPLPVFCWDAQRPEAPGPHHQTRELVAAPSKAAAARAAGVSSPAKLHNLYRTPQPVEQALARSKPGVVFWQPINQSPSDPYFEAPPRKGELETALNGLLNFQSPADQRRASTRAAATAAATAISHAADAVPPPDACPICGGKTAVELGAHQFNDAKVVCGRCGAEGGLHDTEGATKEANALAAVTEWNQRVLTPKAAKVIEHAAALLAEEADSLKECSTTADGAWPEAADKASYDNFMHSVQALRALLVKPAKARRPQ